MTRGAKTLADDWDVRPGGVSTRVALLLRGAEPNPASASFVETPPIIDRDLMDHVKFPAVEGSGGTATVPPR